MPTCGLALAESERYLPSLITKLDALLAEHGLDKQPITVRMTGCPNGCARPYISEIGFVGRNPGKYNLHLGGAADGSRLNRIFKEDADEAEILSTLSPLFADYAKRRNANESFGDFVTPDKNHLMAIRVFLAGAGPGDPELLTLKAYRVIKSADVILHDSLVDARIIALARLDAKCIDVGKRCGSAFCIATGDQSAFGRICAGRKNRCTAQGAATR